MTAQAANSLLLTRYNGSTYDTIGLMRSKSLKLNGEIVDITNDSSSGVRELLAGAGVRSVSVSGSGVFDATGDQELVFGDWAARNLTSWELVIPGYATVEADFMVTDLEIAGDANQEVTFSMTLESSGAITITEA